MEKKFTEELNELIQTKRMHRQWADKGINFITGCGNQCKYCYACEMATRFHHRDPANWGNEILRQKDVDKKIMKYAKMVMFPSSHDNEAPRRRAAGYLKTMLTVYFCAKLCILSQALGHEHIS
jgi:DNA repair photolyase